MRQRDLDRSEKQKDREAARESSLLMAGVLSRLVQGVDSSVGSSTTSKKTSENIVFQYQPDEEGVSEPFPLAVTLTSLSDLLR